MDGIPPATFSPPKARDISTLKIILLLVLFVLTFGSSLIPFALRKAATQTHPTERRRKFAAVFGMLSCFGGGVFLATCLLDLLPHAHESITSALLEYHADYNDFPLSEFLVAIGFFLVLTIEQLVLWFREKQETHHHHEEEEDHEHRPRVPTILNTVDVTGSDEDAVSRDELLEGAEVDIHFDPDSHSTFRAVILVVALSLHATFEGLALGLVQQTSDALQLFGALCIHKSILGFSLGLRLVQSKLSTLGICLCSGIFAIMAPIGGSCGVAVADFVSQQNADMVSGCLGAIACGTFLYVTAFEILPHELNERGFRIWKLLMLFLGYALITVFVFFFPQ